MEKTKWIEKKEKYEYIIYIFQKKGFVNEYIKKNTTTNYNRYC